MSQEDARAFMEKMKNDARFREKILAEEDGEKCLQLINQEGFDFSIEDLSKLQEVIEERDLKDVAGGWDNEEKRKSFYDSGFYEIFGYKVFRW